MIYFGKALATIGIWGGVAAVAIVALSPDVQGGALLAGGFATVIVWLGDRILQ